MAKSTAEIVEKAETLALSLTAGPVVVGKNVLLGLTSDFLSAPRPDRKRLRDTVELIATGSGGHLKRGGGYGDQVKLAAAEIARAMEDELDDQALKSLLGWTARLLLVRRVPGDLRDGKRTGAASGPPKVEAPREPPKPMQTNVLTNVLLRLDRPLATAFRGNRPAASCRPEDLDPELLKVLKSSRGGVRADVEVVKAGKGSRIVGVPKWEVVK